MPSRVFLADTRCSRRNPLVMLYYLPKRIVPLGHLCLLIGLCVPPPLSDQYAQMPLCSRRNSPETWATAVWAAAALLHVSRRARAATQLLDINFPSLGTVPLATPPPHHSRCRLQPDPDSNVPAAAVTPFPHPPPSPGIVPPAAKTTAAAAGTPARRAASHRAYSSLGIVLPSSFHTL